jgi:hypothetical protein
MAEHLNHDVDEEEHEDLAPVWAACPFCGERIEDFLDLDLEDGEWTTCLLCGTVYGLEYSQLT